MSILGLILFSVVVVTASADVSPDAEKLPDVASDLMSILDASGLPDQFKRIARSADVEERFGLITGSLRLVVRLIKGVLNYFISWFIPSKPPTPQPPPPYWPGYPYPGNPYSGQ